ncbi:MAG: LLM class flavin-dependent oxidoreductase [Acidimicrobiales bacterium]
MSAAETGTATGAGTAADAAAPVEAGSPVLSVNLMPEGPVAQVVELAVLAESLGFRRCWVYDEGVVTRDVYVTLAAVAGATERIGIGPGITNPYVRHPGATAAAIATLDELSGGRAFVGLGAGGGLTLGPLAIDRRKPLTTVAQTVTALRGLFSGDRVDLAGEVFSLAGARLDYARPDIEIILAGRGPKMTALGGRVADGFNLSYIHKDLVGSHTAALRREAGDRPFVISYSTMVVTTDADFDEARAGLSFRLVDSPPEVKERIGMSDADTVAIRSALADGGTAAAACHVREEWVPQFVICGTAAEARAELAELMTTHGIDEFQLAVQHLDRGVDQMTALATP